MKIPKTFIPERDLNKVTDSLNDEDNITSLEDLISHCMSPIFAFVCQEGPRYLKPAYPSLDMMDLEGNRHVGYYGKARVDILKFKDKAAAMYNLDRILYSPDFNDAVRARSWDPMKRIKVRVFVKDRYAVFVYSDLDSEICKIGNFYKERFCFKEAKSD